MAMSYFQPHKIHDSGLYDAFDGAVLIYIHKEVELEDVEKRYPADHYVLIDDKLRILTAIKKCGTNGLLRFSCDRVITRWTRRLSARIRAPTSQLSALATCLSCR
jgi:hypothetical protein